MTSCKRNYQYLVIVASLIIMVNVQPVLAKYTIPVDCYYSASTGCGRCVRIKTVVQDIEQNYSGKITVTWKDVDLAEYKTSNFT